MRRNASIEEPHASIYNLEFGLWRVASELVPVKLQTVHVNVLLGHVDSPALHVDRKLDHVNGDLVHVNGRTFSSNPTDGCISPRRNAQVQVKEPFAEANGFSIYAFELGSWRDASLFYSPPKGRPTASAG